MRSRASFFNKHFSLHLLRRFWPMWLLWMSFLLLAGPINLSSVYDENLARFVSYLRDDLLESAQAVTFFSAIFGALMAMAMLSWLYNARTCGLVASLPLRREAAYCTSVLTGLVPMLLLDALVCLIMLLLYHGKGVENRYFLEWLGAAVFGNIGFYGFACFCGLLTGNVLILPAVYGLLMIAVPLAEAGVRSLFSELLYGYSYGSVWSLWLSPPAWLTEHMQVKTLVQLDAEKGIVGVYTLTGLGYLAAFAAAGLAFVLLGTLILKKRHMETAGEVVAVPALRPIFRVCMGLGVGLLGALVFVGAFSYHLTGTAKLVLLLVLLCVFAALGFFAAEMLIKKTLRVFDHGFKQLGVICAVLISLAVLTELDVTGYETRVPRAEDVASAGVGVLREELTEPESVAACIRLHESLIERKAENEEIDKDELRQYVTLSYTLKSGKTLERTYNVACGEDKRSDPDSAAVRLLSALNLPEARRARVYADFDFGASNIREARVNIIMPDAKGVYRQSGSIQLTPEQAIHLYREGVLPDTEAGTLGGWVIWNSPEHTAEQTNLELDITFWPNDEELPQGRAYSPLFISERVLFTSENTLRWLKENLDLEAQPLAGEVEPDGAWLM